MTRGAERFLGSVAWSECRSARPHRLINNRRRNPPVTLFGTAQHVPTHRLAFSTYRHYRVAVIVYEHSEFT